MLFFAQSKVDISKAKDVVEQTGSSVFDWKSLLLLVFAIAVGLALGGAISFVLRRVSRVFAAQADKTSDLGTVYRLRRIETWIIISIAIIRVVVLGYALYIWWAIQHVGAPSANAIIGASAIVLVLLTGVLGPLLRDFAFGAGMMAERWFGVGDLIAIDFPNVKGVVERITLRSTRLRGLNGEVIWVANQTMSGVRVVQKGVRRTALEIFVTNPEKGAMLIDKANLLLPRDTTMLASPLKVVKVVEQDKDIWQITAVGETAPEREWILENTAIEVLKKLDEKEKTSILIVDPVARYADADSEKQLVRAITNARKERKTFNYKRVAKQHKELVSKKK